VARLTAEDILELVQLGESQTVEFKSESETQPEVGELLAALANAEGGTVLFGISDDSVVIGVKKPHGVIQKVLGGGRGCRPPLDSYVDSYTVKVGDKNIVVAQIPPLDSIYAVGGIYRRRHGVENIVVFGDDLKHLALDRMSGDFDRHPLSLSLDALDERKVNNLLAARLVRSLNPDTVPSAPFPEQTALKQLVALGALVQVGDQYQPTVAGLLLLGRKPQEALEQASVQVAAFADQGATFLDRLEVEGTLDEQLATVLAFIRRNTRLGARIEGLLREDLPEYPPTAVREAVVNALLHRNYAVRAPISIFIFPDRLEVLSPGSLLPGLSIEHLEGQHRLRNHVLGRMMYYMAMAEKFGTGLWRIRQELLKVNLPPVQLRQDGEWLRLTMHNSADVRVALPPTHLKPRSAQILGLEQLVQLNPRQRKILRLWQEGSVGKIGRTAYKDLFSVAPITASRDLDHLSLLGLAKRVGVGKNTAYEPIAGLKLDEGVVLTSQPDMDE